MDADLFTMADCDRAGFCPSGIKAWCKTRGIKPRDFINGLKVGIPRAEIEALNDGLLNRALELKDAAMKAGG